ncbi:MAG: lipopolysaccharide biosynthesis protein [Balneolales bacterium]
MPFRLHLLITRVRKSEFFRNSMMMISGAGFAQLIPILIIPLLTRLYTPEEIGILATFVSIFTIFSIIAAGRYEYAIIMPESDQDGIRLLQIAAFFSIVTGAISIVAVFFLRELITNTLQVPSLEPWLWFLPPAITAQGLFMTFSFGLNRKKYYRDMAWGKISQSGSTSIIQVLGGLAGLGIAGLIIGKVTGVIISATWLFTTLYYKVPNFIINEKWSDLKRTAIKFRNYPKYNAPHALTNNVSNNIPVILFVTFFTETIAGFYAMAIRACYAPIQIISIALSQVLGKRLAEIKNKNEDVESYVKRVILYLIILGIFPFGVLFVVSPKLFGFVLGSEWTVTGEYIRILMPWVYLTFISQPLSYIPLLYNRQKMAFGLDIVYLILRLTAILAGVWFESILIALYCYSSTGATMMIIQIAWYVQLSKHQIEK